jgi:hypothetical protein
VSSLLFVRNFPWGRIASTKKTPEVFTRLERLNGSRLLRPRASGVKLNISREDAKAQKESGQWSVVSSQLKAKRFRS